MKKRRWIIVVLAVISCAVGVLALIGYLQSDETGKNRNKVPAIKDEESITDENGTDEIGADETEIILDSSKKENQTGNNTTTDSDKQSGENQLEDNEKEGIESSKPIELPFLPYEGDD